MNAALRRHYDAIQQFARDEWPSGERVPGDSPDDLHRVIDTAAAQKAAR